MSLSRSFVSFLALGLSIALAIWRPPVMGELDLRVYDALVRADAGPGGAPAGARVVAIDESSLSRLGQWPWPRAVLATLVERLHALGASVVALDVLLPEPERSDGPSDRSLARALQQGPTVTGHAFLFDVAGPATACTRHPLELVERQRGESPPSAGLFTAAAGVCTLAELAAAAGASGFINAAPDPDGLLRRAPLLLRFGDRVYPSLALAARRTLGGGPVVLDARSDGSMTMTVASRTVSLDRQGRMLLRIRPAAERLAFIPAADVVEGLVSPDEVRGRMVFVGATALGLRDVVVTAVDRALPGVAVHAAVADTLMGGPAYERAEFAPLMEIAVTAFVALLTSVLVARAGLLKAVIASAMVGAIVWWGGGWLLSAQGLWFSPLYPLAGVVIAIACEGGFAVLHERRRAERERGKRGDAQRLIVQALTTLTETRDVDTGRHARRTQEYTRLVATALARQARFKTLLTTDRIELIATLAPLHDIGKVGVPDAVLRKPGALTAEEHSEMRRHPDIGHDSLLRAESLAGVHDNEVIAVAKEIVHTHHERWDGAGYPRGLRGDEIPVSGRLVALVDAYDALVVNRTYRDAVSHDAAVEAIISGRGQHFDPDVVDAFLTVHEQFRALAAQPAPASPGRT
jgi:HD-GYP domain-containing protein (c-di-GMP phosphodiesterase class II)